MTSQTQWQRYQNLLCPVPPGLTLDVSRMRFEDDFLAHMAPALERAFDAMRALEAGAIANPDEGRQVGHYWLRAPERAPTPELATAIRASVAEVKRFAGDVHAARLKPPRAERFTRMLAIGIGGSALGPMFVADALGRGPADRMQVAFVDNTDPDGIARTLAAFEGALAETLVIVSSKSGGTEETRNGMRLVAEAFGSAGLEFGAQAVAVTLPDSRLDREAAAGRWLGRFPQFDWVGGRTSELSATGLLPAALQGLDVDGLLAGAAACDAATRLRDVRRNPAALLALMWHHAGAGRGERAMVVLPYKDRLLLLGRYLQQLVMESLGKRQDLAGQRVDQGLTVFGNKGSTDQHAYVQQLRDGRNDFFALFVRVLEAGGSALEVSPGVRAGDYLHGFWLGTRGALAENGRESITLTLPRVDAPSLGALIALFERTVGLYASLIGVNAYNQPGVEAGKKAASAALALQGRVLAALGPDAASAEQIAARAGAADEVETVYLLLEHLCASGRARLAEPGSPGAACFTALTAPGAAR